MMLTVETSYACWTLTATALYWRRICLHDKTFHFQHAKPSNCTVTDDTHNHNNEHGKFVSIDVIVE